MNRIGKMWLASVALAMSAGAGARDAEQAGMRFRCEARGSQQHYCSVDTRDGITMVKQLSSTPCLQGRNWDYDRHGVWVSHRCRGEFMTGRQATIEREPAGQSVRCVSRSDQIERCPADTSKGVRLTRILSNSECVENRDWGYDDAGIWTVRGCRAEFELGAGSLPGPAESPSRDLTCQSAQQRMQRCPAVVKHGVEILRHKSKTRCIEGISWGWDRAGVWVDKGCRAEFRVR